MNPTGPNGTSWVFTGWYEEGSNVAWNPFQQVTDYVTLVAHYAQADDYVYVQFPETDLTKFAGDYYVDTNGSDDGFNLAYGDVVAPWQVSMSDAQLDHYVVTGFTCDGKDVSLVGMSGAELADKIASRPAASALYKIVKLAVTPTGGQNACVITFGSADAGWKYKGVQSNYALDVVKGDTVDPVLAVSASNGYGTLAYNNNATNAAFDFTQPVPGDVYLVPQADESAQYYTVMCQKSSSQTSNALTDATKVEYVKSGQAAQDTTAPAPAKDGFEFLGWSESNYPTASLSKDVVLADLSHVTKDLTVYAVYAPTSVTVTWYNGYGSVDSVYTTQTYTENQQFHAPADPTRGGYNFVAWNPQVTVEGQYVYTTLGGGRMYYADGATGDSIQSGPRRLWPLSIPRSGRRRSISSPSRIF